MLAFECFILIPLCLHLKVVSREFQLGKCVQVVLTFDSWENCADVSEWVSTCLRCALEYKLVWSSHAYYSSPSEWLTKLFNYTKFALYNRREKKKNFMHTLCPNYSSIFPWWGPNVHAWAKMRMRGEYMYIYISQLPSHILCACLSDTENKSECMQANFFL